MFEQAVKLDPNNDMSYLNKSAISINCYQDFYLNNLKNSKIQKETSYFILKLLPNDVEAFNLISKSYFKLVQLDKEIQKSNQK